MKTKIFKNMALHYWISSSNFLYSTVEALPTKIFNLVATVPILVFWSLIMLKNPINQLPALVHQDWLVSFFASQFNLAQDQNSALASFFIFIIHTLNIGLFLCLARPYLSKLMRLWACWYIGIHPSHMSWLGRLDYIPNIIECTLALGSILILKKIFKQTESIKIKFLWALGLIILWAPLNIWLGIACITLFASYLWPLKPEHFFILLISYLSAQLITVLSSISLHSASIFLHTKKMLVALFGIGWIPANLQIIRYGFLLFWIISIIGLFSHTTKKHAAGLLLLATGTYLLPQVFIHMHPAYVYTALPAFITTLGILYENTGEANIRNVIKSLIIPIYASFLFNVIMILIRG